jgi:signal transduction histidine kinase/DNA-binding response OmpR family regulator
MRIVILPAPWFTWPAYLVYFLIGSLGFYMVARYYGERIRLRNSLYYEQKLRQQETEINQERSRFFTNFSHELRTPLTLIIGPVQDLINGKVGQEIKFKLELVQRNAISLLELINKMLEFRKTETEHNHLELIHDNFSIFMEKICNNFTYYANHKGLKFSLKSNGDHYLWFDSHKMQIVFNNILSNAFKYTNQGGKVNVILQEEGKYLKVLVEDSGIGIKADELPSIFNLYYHKDKIEKIEGTGLGLALCKNLIELQHGMIEVESKEGEGTRFILWLNTGREEFDKMENVEFLSDNQIFIKQPFIDDLVLNQTPSDDHINPESDKVILIVDDNVDVINYLRSVLAYNFKIITAQNGEEGIEKAFNSIPDLIISDIMMPVKSGIDLCNRLKNTSQTSHIPIILLTAKVEDSDKITGLHSGADAYITKPFNSQYLVAIISGIFENRKKLVNFLSGQIYGPAQPKMEEQTIEHEFLERLKRLIIDKRSNGELYMDELAMELGFSRSSLYRKVKALTGLSINQFSRKIRIRHAAHLIQESDLNISEVAFDMGFNDLKYFRTCFKEEMGVLPSEIKQTV